MRISLHKIRNRFAYYESQRNKILLIFFYRIESKSIITVQMIFSIIMKLYWIELRFADTYQLNIIPRWNPKRDRYLGSPFDLSIIIKCVMNGCSHNSQWEKRRGEGKADFLWCIDRQRVLNMLGLTRDIVMSIWNRSIRRRAVTYVSPACLAATNRIIWLVSYERRRSVRAESKTLLWSCS